MSQSEPTKFAVLAAYEKSLTTRIGSSSLACSRLDFTIEVNN
jgi:hypothetical protein